MTTWKRRISTLIFICFALSLIGSTIILCVDLHVRQSVADRILSPKEAAELPEYDCILVLGCGAPNGKPGPMLTDRLNTSIDLYELGVSKRILMSGDHGQDNYNEVGAMKTFAINAGVSSDAIFMDHAGFSTYESMYRARDVFMAQRVLIVTQEYHLYRALYVARALGLDAYGVPSTRKQFPGQSYYDFREVLARNKDVIYTLFTPEPSYLGEAIPVSGNGNMTNDS